jgi:cytochrome d ubiquinol oxidase subunit II
MWTGFPGLFAAISSTLYIPLTLAAFGIIARGSAFAFRKAVTETWQKRLFGATFATSSVLTPFFLGTVAGAVASGRVPPGVGNGDAVSSWWNPVSVFSGAMAVGVCAYLAAVYLTADARRGGQTDLAELFRRRAMITGVIVGALALAGIAILHADAPVLAHGLTHRALASIHRLAGVRRVVDLVGCGLAVGVGGRPTGVGFSVSWGRAVWRVVRWQRPPVARSSGRTVSSRPVARARQPVGAGSVAGLGSRSEPGR